MNMRPTVRSDGDISSSYPRNDKNQNTVPTSSSNTDKNIDSDLEALAKLRRDYLSNPVIMYLNINSIRNKIGSSLENYTSDNTRQHDTTRVKHDTIRDNTSTTRQNTSTTRHNTRQHEYNTTQHEYNTTQQKCKRSFGSKNGALLCTFCY